MDIEEDIKKVKELNNLLKFFKTHGWIPNLSRNTNINETIEAIEHILAEREEDKKKIAELEAKLEFYQWGDLDNLKFEEYMKEFIPKQKVKEKIEENRIFKDSNVLVNRYFKLKDNSIPVQKVKDLLTEIQEEYNEVQEQFDCIWNKKSKDDYDRYKLQEFSTMQQQLGFFIGKLEEMLEDK